MKATHWKAGMHKPRGPMGSSVDSLGTFSCYFHANCSSDLANCMSPLLQRPLYTRLSTGSSLWCPNPFCKS